MYQPLKRFTQCGSLTMLFAVFIVLFGVSSTALTTFGKSNSQNTPTVPPPKAKDCVTQSDCTAITDTSCVRDYPSQQLRCLCGDNNPPINGKCAAKYKGLRHTCTDSNQCDEGMICTNETKPSTVFRSSPSKLCLCDEEVGYEESINLNYCSGSVPLLTGLLVPLLSLFIGSLVASRPILHLLS